ncbi:MAG: class I SAM-dependent methyltransferase [Acidobacteria bacterium]|nr:class I SAM-dependent methyltransferase [Acidobacteriota bacterium]
MSQQERAVWDERFRSGDHADSAPDPFLFQLEEYWQLLPPRIRALDLACGTGRNAVWLARKGCDVTAVDISIEGLRKTRTAAQNSGLRVDTACYDLDAPPDWRDRFDLIICFFFLERKLFPWLRAALRAGGVVLYKTYTVDQEAFAGRPRHKSHLLRRQELLNAFRNFRVLHYQEMMKDRGVAQIIARKD